MPMRVMYVDSYIIKSERSMGELLKRLAAEVRKEELRMPLLKVDSAFLTHREISAQEPVYKILSLPIKQLHRSVVFVEKIAVFKNNNAREDFNDDDTNVFQKSH